MRRLVLYVFFPMTILGSLCMGVALSGKAGELKVNSKPWAGYKTNLTNKDDWDLSIRYSEFGEKYFALVENPSGSREGLCEGTVDDLGNLEKVECIVNWMGFDSWALFGNVLRIELVSGGSYGIGAIPVFIDKKLTQRIEAATAETKPQ